MKKIWQGPNGNSPVAGNLRYGELVETENLSPDILKEWEEKKWLMAVPAKAATLSKEVKE